jgi:hypothetical protein
MVVESRDVVRFMEVEDPRERTEVLDSGRTRSDLGPPGVVLRGESRRGESIRGASVLRGICLGTLSVMRGTNVVRSTLLIAAYSSIAEEGNTGPG